MTTCGLLIRPIDALFEPFLALFLCSKMEVAVARMNTFQWNHSTTMANHSCPGHSDVWRFCNNDFIFVVSTCRFFIRPGRGQGAGSLPIPVSSLRRAAPQRPVAKQHGGTPSLRAQLRVYWLARQIEDCRSTQAAGFAKTDLLIRRAAIEHRYTNWQKGSFVLHLIIHHYRYQIINTLWPGDAIWRHRTGSISTHLTHCGREDLWKWTIFNTMLTSPKSWLSQEDLDAGCEHSLVPMDS